MREFPITEEFRVDFRRAVRRYFKRVEESKALERKVEAFGEPRPFNSWRYDLAAALQERSWERISNAKSRIIDLLKSLVGGEAVAGVEVYDEPTAPGPAFPAVEAEGFVFALVGEEEHFVVRPAWMHVRIE